jgi:TetR/AcrR family transcriptional regulator
MDNREQLLDCALTLFSQRGYDAVGVQEIVESAGVTKPTLYHYFESKRGLLEALLQRESSLLISHIAKASIYQGDIVLTLERITQVYFDYAQSHPQYYWMQYGMFFSPPDSEAHQAILPYHQEQFDILCEVFNQAAESHGNLRGRHKRYALGFLGAINAVIGLSLEGKLELTGEVVYQTVHQFMYGIFS